MLTRTCRHLKCLQVFLTWSGGIPCFVGAWLSTVYGLWQLIELHEIKGRRFNRYHELGQYALGISRFVSMHEPN